MKRTAPIYLTDDPADVMFDNYIKRSSKLIAFTWVGGKFSHLNWLLPLLPKAQCYVEPFGGSAAVILNREPSKVDVYNDIMGEVCNFFRVLRDRPRELVRKIDLTPHAREEFYHASYDPVPEDEVEAARRFFVLARQCTSGRNNDKGLGNYGFSKIRQKAQTIGKLMPVAERLLNVVLENRPALDVIRLYDAPTTLFYCDPPYAPEARTTKVMYRNEMSTADHEALAEQLNACSARVALSGYASELYDRLYPAERGWFKTCEVEKPSPCSDTRSKRQDILWTNYDPAEVA